MNRELLVVPSEWKSMPSNQKDALLQGVTQYFTGRPCDNGHISPRNAKSKGWLVCVRERSKNQYFLTMRQRRLMQENELKQENLMDVKKNIWIDVGGNLSDLGQKKESNLIQIII